MSADQDPLETQEWRDALGSVVEFDGPDRAAYLLRRVARRGAADTRCRCRSRPPPRTSTRSRWTPSRLSRVTGTSSTGSGR